MLGVELANRDYEKQELADALSRCVWLRNAYTYCCVIAFNFLGIILRYSTSVTV